MKLKKSMNPKVITLSYGLSRIRGDETLVI